MLISPQMRKEMLEAIPWVTKLKRPVRCTALKSDTPLKAIFGKNGKPPTHEDNVKWSCKSNAYWKFRASKRSWSEDGYYCMSHLFVCGLYGDPIEEDRTNKWLEKKGYYKNV